MADNETDLGQLSSTEQDALQQYLAVTNQEVAEAIPLLQRSQWNVQVRISVPDVNATNTADLAQIAIAKFFDGEGPDPLAEAIAADNIPRTSARHENLQASLLASEFSSRTVRRETTDPAPRIVPQQSANQTTPWVIGLLLAPFGWGWKAATALFRTIFYALSFLPASIRPTLLTNRLQNTLAGGHGRRMLMPRDAAARFKREFEEEYGPNDLPFFEGGVAQAHDIAKKDLKFLLVILLSPEHDDTISFIRDTLLAPEVVNFIKDPSSNIVLWGGNVLDSEAYQVSTEYTCTKFPFTALVCLTPKEGSTRMGIVKRLTGSMPANDYLSALQGAMEKYGADMDGVRAERTAQEFSRSLRDQQDSAYERSLAIDRERAREKKQAAAAAEEAEQRARDDAAAAARLEEKRQQWRSWRATKIRPEPPTGDRNVVRVALKMPEALGAERIVRRFAADAPMEELYAFVDCYDRLRDGGEEELATQESDREEPEDYEHKFMFRISSTLPRVVYESSNTATMAEKIGKSGNLIVEEIAEDSDDEEDEEEDE